MFLEREVKEMDKFERLVNEIMRECEQDGEPVTRAEAEEMAKMEMGEKEVKRYESKEVTKKATTRERKVDEEKGHLLGCIKTLIEGLKAENITVKTETELNLTYNGNAYTVKLTKHRPPKQ